jgi:hypothetical protein
VALTYKDIQDEVKRRSTRDSGGTTFDTGIKTVVNSALFRLAREAKWRSLRREETFETVTSYTTGSGGGTFTNASKSITMVGATFLTDGIQPGRYISLQGDSDNFVIDTITGETTLTLTKAYGGTTISGTGTYEILPQEKYNLPVQASHRCFLWHEEYGYPLPVRFATDQSFISSGAQSTDTNIPTVYRMWGEDMVKEQVKEASVITISSSSTSDTSIDVTVFGTVGGYPDFEIITTNASDGTTGVAGLKSFTKIERVVKNASSDGRITATANSTNTTVAVMPVGDTTSGIQYKKVKLWPLPNTVFPINVFWYKDPYRLVNDGDVHELGQDFDEAIINLATAITNYESDKQEGDRFMAMYMSEMKSLRKTNVDKIDWYVRLGRPLSHGNLGPHRSLGYNQVGSHFGPGTRF